MRSTLFYLPHEIGGVPVFGLGWAFGLLVTMVVAWSLFSWRKRGSWDAVVESLPMWVVAGVLLVLVFPNMESTGITNERIGLPIRGYGVMLTLGGLSGLYWTYRRARVLGLTLDHLLSLMMWTFLPGILGARLFYVIQKWDELPGETVMSKLVTALKFTEGGLVVYGSIMGALLGLWLWSWRKRCSPLAIADLVAPGFFVGLAFGRLGCLLHGCCFGGICLNPSLPAIRFPSGSEPYMVQLERGELLGIHYEPSSSPEERKIASLDEGSWAQSLGLQVGQRVGAIDYRMLWPAEGSDPAGPHPVVVERLLVEGKTLYGKGMSLPARSLPLHPAQIYSSINALLIAIVLYLAWPIPKQDGYIFAGGLGLYAFVRILEEMIRSDELGQFGTQLTISQWVSLLGLILAVAIFVTQRGAKRTLQYAFAEPANLSKTESSRR